MISSRELLPKSPLRAVGKASVRRRLLQVLEVRHHEHVAIRLREPEGSAHEPDLVATP